MLCVFMKCIHECSSSGEVERLYFPYITVYPFRRNFNHKKEYTYSTLHWHHGAVSALCFTPEGRCVSSPVYNFFIYFRRDSVSKIHFVLEWPFKKKAIPALFPLYLFLLCLTRHQPAEWRHGVGARPVAIQAREPAGLPAPPGRCHHTHRCLTWWSAVLYLTQWQQ